MKTTGINISVTAGVFLGGEIVSGKFKTECSADSSDECPPALFPEECIRQDMGAAFALDSLIPPIETDVLL